MPMLTSKFPVWVDLEGLEILDLHGQKIPGLYAKFPNYPSCVCMNFTCGGVLVNPSIFFITRYDGYLMLNSLIKITSDNKVTIPSLEPQLLELTATANGVYEPTESSYYSKATVAVPPPDLEELTVTENGVYLPSQDVYGFSKLTVDVPQGLSLNDVDISKTGIWSVSGAMAIFAYTGECMGIIDTGDELEKTIYVIYRTTQDDYNTSTNNVRIGYTNETPDIGVQLTGLTANATDPNYIKRSSNNNCGMFEIHSVGRYLCFCFNDNGTMRSTTFKFFKWFKLS